MNASSLDEVDQTLLKALKLNARASLVSLSRDIGLSRSATHDRITRLEERGVITGYTITTSAEVAPRIRAFLTVRFVPGTSESSHTIMMRAFEGVEAAYCLSGDIDMLIYCETDTAEQLGDLRDQISKIDGIVEISTRQVLTSAQA